MVNKSYFYKESERFERLNQINMEVIEKYTPVGTTLVDFKTIRHILTMMEELTISGTNDSIGTPEREMINIAYQECLKNAYISIDAKDNLSAILENIIKPTQPS